MGRDFFVSISKNKNCTFSFNIIRMLITHANITRKMTTLIKTNNFLH